jgi:hypothetical protein
MANEELTQEELNEDKFDEEWVLVTSDKFERALSKNQARYLQQVTATGERGIINFETFAINIPFIIQFYRVRRFLKKEYQLSANNKGESTWEEKLFKPIPPEKWEELKKKMYQKIGK